MVKGVEKTLRRGELQVEEVGDSSWRCLRFYEGIPFAQYFVDASGTLPDPEKLYAFQEGLLGAAYFANRGLQWSTYMWFVLDPATRDGWDSGWIAAIEQDREFARKAVITPNELSQLVLDTDAPLVARREGSGIEDVWFDNLAKEGFEEAVFAAGRVGLERRLDMIRESNRPKRRLERSSVDFSQGNDRSLSLPVLELRTKGFRQKIDGVKFPLSGVTLVTGSNGAGKTSILEALEFFYCGTVARDREGVPDSASVNVVLEDGTKKSTSTKTPVSVFKRRNAHWFGKADLKSSTLDSSFARFNFFDVDSAAKFSDVDEDDLKDELSKLIIGPAATELWKHLTRLRARIPGELRRARADLKGLKAERETADVEAAVVKNAAKMSESAWRGLEESFSKLGFQLRKKDRTVNGVVEIGGEIAYLHEVLELPSELSFLSRPVTLDAIEAFSAEGASKTRDLRKLERRFAEATSRSESLEEELRNFEDWSDEYLDPALIYVSERFDQIREAVGEAEASLSCWEELSSLSVPPRDYVVEFQDLSLVDAKHLTTKSAAAAREKLIRAERDYEKQVSLAEGLQQISATLYATAARVRKHNHAQASGELVKEPCPLCGEVYPTDELSRRIDESAKAAGSFGASALEDVLVERRQVAAAASGLESFVDALTKSPFSSNWNVLGDAISDLGDVHDHIEAARSDFSEAKDQYQRLGEKGLTEYERDEIFAELREFTDQPSDQEFGEIAKAASKEGEASLKRLRQQLARQDDRAQAALEEMKSITGSKYKSPSKVLADSERFRDRVGIAEEFVSTVRQASRSRLKGDASLSETRRLLRSVTRQLQTLEEQLRNEHNVSQYAGQRVAEIDERMELAEEECETWQRADQVFRSLTDELSIERATEEEAVRNHEAIDWIFRRIQSPPDFQGLDKGSLASLVRLDSTVARAHQVSTGQRSALALSAFLAMNRQSVDGPPVILIDDPIAHVDDMNTLAFLDYLREVALSGDRQIVFATASSKLAGLFRRKFEFLSADGGFSEISLSGRTQRSDK